MVEGVKTFNYIGQTLDQTEDYWPGIKLNIKQVRKFWGRLSKFPRR